MRGGILRLVFFLLTTVTWVQAQRPSGLVGKWVGKVQAFDVEMEFVLNADGTADLEGSPGTWRAQGNRLYMTEEGETTVYTFKLQGAQLTLTGGDLEAPMVLVRRGDTPPSFGGAAPAPSISEPRENTESTAPPSEAMPPASGGTARRGRGLTEAEVFQLLEGGVPSRRVTELVGERGATFSLTPALASRLKASGAGDDLLDALQNTGGAALIRGPAAASNPLARASSVGKTPGAEPASPAHGIRYRHEPWGVSFVVPQAWKVADRKQALLLGSDTEPG